MLGFSIWYAKQGYGKLTTMPAFNEAEMEKAVQAVWPETRVAEETIFEDPVM